MTTKLSLGVKKTNTDKIFDFCNMIVWTLILIAILYPLWLIIVASLSDPDAIMLGEVFLWPVNPSWMGYEAVFQHQELLRSYANSIFYTVVGSFVSVIITMMAAYALTRKFRGRKVINLYIVITMFFNGGLIPSFIMNRNLGLYNTVLIMIILNSVSVWNLMVARTFIASNVPNELYEAAAIDGADHFTYFVQVVLPLSGTIIAVLAVYYGVARWNDYFTALVYIRDRIKLPLQTILREVIATLTTSTSDMNFFDAYADSQGITEALRKAQVAKYCCIVVSTAPTVLLYMFMQKYFVKGVLIGSIKG
jgi:putative aldouronate transport system permease protein